MFTAFRINGLKTTAVIIMIAMTTAATLTSCMPIMPPSQTTVLSRLPAEQPGAASASPKPLTAAERERYNAIDQWVMQEQNGVIIEPLFYSDYYRYGYGDYGDWYGWPQWGQSVYDDYDYGLSWPWW